MSPNGLLPKEYTPEVLAALEVAYQQVWATLYARVPEPNEEMTKNLGIALSQALAALATQGVTDPRELRRRALEAVVLNPR